MASQKSHSPNKRTAPRGARTRTAPSPGHSKGQKHGSKRSRPNNSANPKMKFDHYTALARAATASGDAIESENCYQHAEHYFRHMKEKTA